MRKIITILGVFVVFCGVGFWAATALGLIPGYSMIRSYTDDASGLTDGTNVRIDGIPVGFLDRQRLTGSSDRLRRVEFEMKVKNAYLAKIPEDSVVGVVADNLVGDHSINIARGHSARHIQPGGELRSVQAIDPNIVMGQIGNEMQALQKIADRVNSLLAGVDAGRGSIGKLSKDWPSQYSDLPAQVQSLVADYRNAHGTLNKLLVDNGEISGELDATRQRINDIMGAFQAGQGTAGKLPEMRKEIDRALQEFDALNAAVNTRTGNLSDLQQRIGNLAERFNGIAARINAGQGTIGQFLVNPRLSETLAGTSSEFQQMAKDMRTNPRKFFTFRLALF
jgi:phospholipid/cholesterol/gamma-HCH transport system substrate-binding protein